MPMIELTTGATLHYIETEERPANAPIVLVHGMLGTAETHFPRLIDWLRPTYRLIGPSMRGYGESLPKPRTFPYDFYEQDTADLIALVEALQLPRPHLIGYSDGGEIVMLAAALRPDLFRSVTAWGAIGAFSEALRPVVQRMLPATWITAEEMALHGFNNPEAFVGGWVNAFTRMIDAGGDLTLSKAHQISVPLLLMLGEQDTLNPVSAGQALVERVPNGRLVTFKCGHAVHDQAWEEFQAVVGDFLKQS